MYAALLDSTLHGDTIFLSEMVMLDDQPLQTERSSAEAILQSKRVVLHTRVVTGTGGGPDKTLLNSGRFLDSLGYQSICAYMHPPLDAGFDDVRKRARSASTQLLSVPDRGAWDWRVVRRLLAICREEHVGIWHAHDYKSNALGLLLRRFHTMKLVSTVHGWVRHTRRTPLYYWLDRRCLPRYDHVICVSEDLRQQCLRSGVRPERLSLIQNAIDTQEFQRQRSTSVAKAELGFSTDQILIGAVGRLSPEKGFDQLIRAVAALLRAGSPIQLAIIGEGESHGELDRLIDELNVREQVQLLGFRADVLPLYEAMDVYALSSLREGLPNVVLEAMAMGVPVVATRVAGVPQLIDDESNGLLVDCSDVNQLQQALQRLIADDDLRAQLATAARKTIENDFSFHERMLKVANIYDSLPQ